MRYTPGEVVRVDEGLAVEGRSIGRHGGIVSAPLHDAAADTGESRAETTLATPSWPAQWLDDFCRSRETRAPGDARNQYTAFEQIKTLSSGFRAARPAMTS